MFSHDVFSNSSLDKDLSKFFCTIIIYINNNNTKPVRGRTQININGGSQIILYSYNVITHMKYDINMSHRVGWLLLLPLIPFQLQLEIAYTTIMNKRITSDH